MINAWIESVFIKRAVLAFCTTLAAHVAAHALPGLDHLTAAGISVTISVDPNKLANFLTVTLAAVTQGGHEWIAVKYPNIGKYI